MFVHSPEQKAAARASKEAPEFLEAEDYHQQRLEKWGLASCHLAYAAWPMTVRTALEITSAPRSRTKTKN